MNPIVILALVIAFAVCIVPSIMFLHWNLRTNAQAARKKQPRYNEAAIETKFQRGSAMPQRKVRYGSEEGKVGMPAGR